MPQLDEYNADYSLAGAQWLRTWLRRAHSAAVVILGLMAGALTAAAGLGWGAHALAPAAAAATVTEFTLTAQEVDWELFPGTTVKAWAYNGQVPGPEIRVREGEKVRITFKNELPAPSAVHWHGIDVPVAMDGVPGLTQDAVPPGGTFVYEFTATNPGTRWYHSHQDAELQGPLGLYGPFIVEPKTPEPVRYDREYTYVLSEWDLDLTPAIARGEESLPRPRSDVPLSKQLDFDLFLFNGKAHESIPPVVVKQGERVRLRLINAGNLLHTIHSHGHSFKIVATDGNPVPRGLELTKDSVTLGPSERVDLELYATNPGDWMFHCHMEHHMANGMMTTLRYEGFQSPAPAQSVSIGQAGPAAHTAHAGHTAPAVPAQAAKAAPAALPVSGAARITMVDNRYRDAAVTIKAGTTVEWANDGTNVHTASGLDGSFDSGAVPVGKTFAYTFDKPGQYQYFCRQHLLNGMTGTIIVQ